MEIKKRGRKKGSKMAPRAVVLVCSAVVSGNLVTEEIVYEGEMLADDEAQDRASADFAYKYNTVPTVKGPYFRRFGAIKASTKKSLNKSLLLDNDDLLADIDTSRKFMAVYNGWNVSVNMFKSRQDICVVFFRTEVSGNGKTTPKPMIVELSEIEDMRAA